MTKHQHRVINLKSDPLPPCVKLIDRRSAFGNPFKITDGSCTHPDCGPGAHPPVTRDLAIEAYSAWLKGMLAKSPRFLEPLRDKCLACWCAPEHCHGDVIMAMLYD